MDAATLLAEWGLAQDEARRMLRERICPACRQGPWKSPLNHASNKHGIDGFTMRDACGLTTVEAVTDPALSERFAENGRLVNLTRVRKPGPRSKPQRTTAGRGIIAKNLAVVNDDPALKAAAQAAAQAARTAEVHARQSASLRRRWAERKGDA